MAVTTAAAIGMGLSAAGTAYAANRASKSKGASGSDPYEFPRLSQYGSSIRRIPVAKANGGGNFVQATFDPSIRGLREQALGRLPDYRAGIGESYGALDQNLSRASDELGSNQNPFIQARVNPLLARAAEGRGALSRGLTRRGLGGSSLYSSGLGNYEAEVGRAVGDQQALATQESLSAKLGVDTQRYNSALSALQAFQSMDATEQGIASQNLSQELQALGMTEADVGAAMQAAGLNMQQQQLKNETIFRGMDTMGRIAGSYNQSPALSGNTASPSAYNAFTR